MKSEVAPLQLPRGGGKSVKREEWSVKSEEWSVKSEGKSVKREEKSVKRSHPDGILLPSGRMGGDLGSKWHIKPLSLSLSSQESTTSFPRLASSSRVGDRDRFDCPAWMCKQS